MAEAPIRGQLLLLSSTVGAALPYAAAAKKLGVEYVLGIEAGALVAAACPDPGITVLPLIFAQRESALQIVEYAMEHPLAAIVAADELCAPSCARAASMMGRPSNPPKAADACQDKFSLRQRLSNAGLRTPLLGDVPPASRRVAVAAILDGDKMRVLGSVEEQTVAAAITQDGVSVEIPRSALEAVWRATRVVSLSYGPVYAQLGIAGNDTCILDLAPAIPMRLEDVLRFRIPLVDDNVSLAEVILRHALGLDIARVHRQ